METSKVIIYAIGIMVLDICILMIPMGLLIGIKWVRKKHDTYLPTTKPVLIVLLSELINVAVVVTALYFMSRGGDNLSFYFIANFIAVVSLGSYLLLIFGLPFLNLFGLAWLISMRKKRILTRRRIIIWALMEATFIVISLLIFSKTPLSETLRSAISL